ncbi:aminotransferase class I/II-fold pyridoxal phosphate-dependent enzyme [Pedobacter changchengzhani]|uniref:Aminotransferase class I/II-fold pyridoxal phosphate-dependent enzyme n=1 Tax=Pedobacter changchengzhani TaxID=2529274 RepID=A0A4R5MLY7_9SPHI|nr:GntG family PLP-dependent aldolase [Pedobacter changchengzhani]TDG36694.1 aminotransferase class I/II-fold pyridoxal phosphate-dependent enzyme [Pedobacter changchengzhani]
MNNDFLDFRSDTVTRPTAGMLDAMLHAKVGDDVFGEDETVSALEKKLAKMFNMEAGLFCPSGTMTNQIAIKCFTQPMDEVICDQASHVYRYEGGGIAYHSGASVRLLHGERGILTPQLIEPEINEYNIHYPNSSLVVLENTVNKGGGSCYHLAQIEPIHQLCKAKGLKLHLDGARIFNALQATGDEATSYGNHFDGISVCLSKGLGAPVGSVLLSDKETIKKATKIRKAFGGGMRQAGFLAAAGIYALDHHIKRLKDDHNHAAALADALSKAHYVKSVMPVETNIVIFEVEADQANQIVNQFKAKGLLCGTTSAKTIRLVTHLDLSADMIDRAIEIILHLQG